MRKNSENHPLGTIAPFIGGIIPSANIGNIFLNSKSGNTKMIKMRSGNIKIGKNNSAALPNTSKPPLTIKAQRNIIDAIIKLIGVLTKKRVNNKFRVSSSDLSSESGCKKTRITNR